MTNATTISDKFILFLFFYICFFFLTMKVSQMNLIYDKHENHLAPFLLCPFYSLFSRRSLSQFLRKWNYCDKTNKKENYLKIDKTRSILEKMMSKPIEKSVELYTLDGETFLTSIEKKQNKKYLDINKLMMRSRKEKKKKHTQNKWKYDWFIPRSRTESVARFMHIKI